MRYLVFLPVLAFGILGMAPGEKSDTTKVRIVEDQMASKEDMGDPTRVICRKLNTTGSRLGSKRICATAAEWDARKQQNRKAIERVQSQRVTE